MSAPDDVAARLCGIYIRAIRPEQLEDTCLGLLKALLALAYAEGVEAGARQIVSSTNEVLDKAINNLREVPHEPV